MNKQVCAVKEMEFTETRMVGNHHHHRHRQHDDDDGGGHGDLDDHADDDRGVVDNNEYYIGTDKNTNLNTDRDNNVSSKATKSYWYYLKSHWKVLILGQFLSLLLATGGAAQATLHLNCSLSAPTFTMSVIYFLLWTTHIIPTIRTNQKASKYQHVQQEQQQQHTEQLEDHHQHHASEDDGTDDNQRQYNHHNLHHHQQKEQQQEPRRQQSQEDQDEEGNLRKSAGTPVTNDEQIQEKLHQQHQSQQEQEDGRGKQQFDDIGTRSYPKYSFFGLFPLYRPVWQYFIISFLDVEANAITMLSFRYTTLTSVTLFDALAIPSSMIISRLFVSGRRYTTVHYLGVISCMVGIIVNVFQDYESDHEIDNIDDIKTNDMNGNSTTTTTTTTMIGSAEEKEREEYPHKLFGDLLAITGGILYGLNDVLTEVTVRQIGTTTEYLGVMGFFAFVITFIQAAVLEWEDILAFFGHGDADHASTCSIVMGWWLLLIFATVTICSYVGAANFLLISEAAFFNLSLLTGDLWSVLFSIIAEHIIPSMKFFFALFFVLSGVIIYEMAPSPVLDDEKVESEDDRHEIRQRNNLDDDGDVNGLSPNDASSFDSDEML